MQICLFDIDGTLVRSGGAGKAAMEMALQETFSVELSPTHVSYSGRTDRAIGRDLFRLHGVPFEEDNWKRFIATYLRVLPDCLARSTGNICPGIVPLLDTLETRSSLAVGLLTGNLREGARVKLGHYGLYQRFAFGGFGDHHWERDHVAHEAREAVHQHLGRTVDPDRIWVIGDTPLDVQCARAIGARAVAVATGFDDARVLEAAEPDLLLDDFSDPGPLLSQLDRQ